MSYNLGSAEGSVVINYDGTAATKAKEDIEGIGQSAKGVEPHLQGAANKAGAVGLVIAAGFGVAVKGAADFEQRMSAVAAVSGASEGQLDSLRDKALQLGKDTAFSATESASAIEELVKAGLSVEDVLNGAADATVNLAAAGEIAMPEAAKIASNAMNQFGLTAEDMVGVVDNIAGAANASAIDVSEFGYSLSQVGAVANLAGVDFEDTATAIALLGNAGIVGSDAGTSLKSMFSNLQPDTKKTTDMFKELGLITEDGSNKFYDAEGNLKSLSQVSGILQGSLKGMTAAQKQATLQVLFGADGIRAAAILADAGAKGFDNMAESMNKVSAADVAAKRMDNLKGKLEAFQGSLETLGIVVGTLLLPALTKIIEFLTSMLDVFLELPQGVQVLIAAFIGLVGASLLFFAAFVKLFFFLKGAKAAFVALKAAAVPAWLAALGPIALVVAAVAAVIGILVLCYKRFEGFRNLVDKVGGAIKSGLINAFNKFKDAAGPALEKVRSVFEDKLLPALIKAKNTIAKSLGPAFKTISDAVKNDLLPALAPLLPVLGVLGKIIGGAIIVAIYAFAYALTGIAKAIGYVAPFVARFISGVATAFAGFIGIVSGFINVIVGLFTGDFSKMWDGVKQIFSGGIQAVGAILGTIFAPLLGPIQAVGSAIAGVFSSIWNTVKAVVSAGINFVTGIIRGGLAILGAIWGAFWGTFGGLIRAAFSLVVNIARIGWAIVSGVFRTALLGLRIITSAVWNGIVAVIRTAWNFIKNVVRAGIAVVRAVVLPAWNALKAVTSAVWNGIMAVIRAVWARIGGTVMAGVNRAKSLMSSAWNAIKSTVSNAWNAIVQAATKGVSGVVDKVSGIKDKVLGAVAGFGTMLYNSGAALVQGLIDGITSKLQAAADAAGSIAKKVKDFFPGSPVKTGPLMTFNQGGTGKELVDMFVGGVESKESEVERAIRMILSASDIEQELATVGSGPSGYDPMVELASSAPDSRRASGRGREGLRMVEGELSFRNGRAYIRGLAEEVVDENDNEKARRRRRGGSED